MTWEDVRRGSVGLTPWGGRSHARCLLYDWLEFPENKILVARRKGDVMGC
jgi:hypothetical protein